VTKPSLARERSILAWQRTALAAFSVAALLAKLATVNHRPLEYAAAGTSLTAACLAAIAEPRRQSGADSPPPVLCLLFAGIAAVTAALALVVVATT